MLDSSDDLERAFCRCRSYTISEELIGSTGAVIRHPIRKCAGVLGYSVRDNTRLVNFMESVRSEINAAEVITGETDPTNASGADIGGYEASAND